MFFRNNSFYGVPAKNHKVDTFFLEKQIYISFPLKKRIHFMTFRWATVKTVGSEKHNS